MRTLLAGLLVFAMTGSAVAQLVDQALGQPPSQPVIPQTEPARFDQLVRRDPAGKIIRLSGFVDIIALHLNPQVDQEAWSKAGPVIDEWVLDTDRSVIDNLDFVEALDDGVLSELDLLDAANNRRVMEMMMQFIAIGNLTPYLESKGALTRVQAQQNTNMVNEHYQQIMNEVREEAQRKFSGLSEEERSNKVIHAQSKFIFDLMSRDAVASYERQLDLLAPAFPNLLSGLKIDQATRTSVQSMVGAIKDARPGAERRKVTKAALRALPFDVRREVLGKSLAAAPRFDPRTAYSDIVAWLKNSN